MTGLLFTSRPRASWRAGIAGLLLAALPALSAAQAQPVVQGAGATFPSKVYQRWAQSYEASQRVKVAYKATGSGDGVKQITARAVAFGGTDSPLSPEDLAKHKLVQIPTLVGGVVPVVRLPGVGNNQLVLSGEVLADLFAGKVARWNDPRLAALNPGLTLPNLPVKRVVRADRSGTTDGFTKYLALVSPSFKAEVGAGQLPKWPGEPVTGEGNDGVSKAFSATEGAIAYVSFDRATQDKLPMVRLRNVDGLAVAASETAFRAAIRQSDVHLKGDDMATLLNRPGAESWPITLTSFVLFDAEPAKASDVDPALRFFYWSFQRGDELLKGTGFAPLPSPVQAKLAARFLLVKPKDGGALSYYKQ